jgi:hypothetical protein
VRSNDSFVRQGVNFDFLPAVQCAQVAAFGVAAHVAGFRAFAVEHATEMALEVFAIRADAEAGGVVGVVIEQRGDAVLNSGSSDTCTITSCMTWM